MKKLIFSLFLVLTIMVTTGFAKELTFQWEQDVMVVGDKWEIHVSEIAGGPYSHLVDIVYVEAQTTYQVAVEVDIPQVGYYFVIKKVRGEDGESSGWSNELYYMPVNAPFNLKLIFGS